MLATVNVTKVISAADPRSARQLQETTGTHRLTSGSSFIMETNRCPPGLQKRLDRLSRNDPFITAIDICSKRLRDEDAMALGVALQQSTHVCQLRFDASNLMSIEGCATMEKYLKTTKSLRDLTIRFTSFPLTSSQRTHVENGTNRLLSALRENSSVQELTLEPAGFCCQTLIQYLNTPNISLQKLALVNGHSFRGSELDAQNIGRAIRQCRTLQEVDLGPNLCGTLIVSILQYGICNHPSLQRLKLELMVHDSWTADVVAAMLNILDPPISQLQSLELEFCNLTHEVTQHIMEGLKNHPTFKTLKMDNCEPRAVQALQNSLVLSLCNLQTLVLEESILNTDDLHQILLALKERTSLKYLKLHVANLINGMRDEEKSIFALVQTILQQNPHMTSLSLGCCEFLHEDAVSFMKTVVQAPCLTELELYCCNFGDAVFKSLSSWLPQNNTHQKSMLQTLDWDGDDEEPLTEEGMQNFLTFLQIHTPQLKTLTLSFDDFPNDSATHFAKILSTISLVQLRLIGCGWHVATGQMIPELLRNHSTLKVFKLKQIMRADHYANFGCVIQMATETIRVCKLQSLSFDFDLYYTEERDSESSTDSPAFMQAIATNLTLTDVYFSDAFVHNLRTWDPEKIVHFTSRNKKFQKIASTLRAGNVDKEHGHSDHQDDLVNSGSNSISSIPMGLWPHIMEAAHQQYPDATMLHILFSSLLSSHNGDLLFGREY
jgi:hypothetical protein